MSSLISGNDRIYVLVDTTNRNYHGWWFVCHDDDFYRLVADVRQFILTKRMPYGAAKVVVEYEWISEIEWPPGEECLLLFHRYTPDEDEEYENRENWGFDEYMLYPLEKGKN